MYSETGEVVEKADLVLLGSDYTVGMFTEAESPTAFIGRLSRDLAHVGLKVVVCGGPNCGLWFVDPTSLLTQLKLATAFVPLLVYSEREVSTLIQSGGVSSEAIRLHLFSFLALAVYRCGTVGVLLADGSLPFTPPHGLPVIDVRMKGAFEIVESLVTKFGPFLKDARMTTLGLDAVRRRYASLFKKVDGTIRPYKVLVLGPGRPSPEAGPTEYLLWNSRELVKSGLRGSEVVALYGEDFADFGRNELERHLNEDLKERIAGLEVDVIVAISSGPGSFAEIGSFAQYKELASKTIIAVNAKHRDGYVSKGPIKNAVSLGAELLEFSEQQESALQVGPLLLEHVRRRLEEHLNNHIRFNR